MKTLGSYVIQRKLGSGGMGVVYLAHHPELGRRALKVIHANLSDHEAVVRFQREFEALAVVSKHPHVVPVHTAGFDDGRLYYVMDAIDGEDLQVRLERGRLPAREAAEILRGLSDAVATLHAAGVVHRDLKPANVLLDARGHAYLTDFGLARLLGDERGRLTLTGELLGTPDYMAPEQALGLKEIGPPTDVYALGLILFAALSGQRAITGKTRMEVLQQAAQGQHASLVELAPDTPQALVDWVERCLEPAPEQRPHAAELRDGLDAWLVEGVGQTAGDALRRERGHVRLAIAACVVLAVLLGLALAVAVPRSRRRWDATLERVTSQVHAHEAALSGDSQGLSPLVPLARELDELEPASPEAAEARDAVRALLWAVEADSASRRRDPQACAAAVEACTPPASANRELRRRLEAHLNTAQAWLHLEGARPAEDVRDLRRGVERARQRWPERPDLLALSVRLALEQDRPGEAQDLLALAAEPPPELRLEVALAGDDPVELEAAVTAEGLPPELEARALLRLAASEVDLAAGRALERVRRALGLQPEGLEAERTALRERTQAELNAAIARWGQLPPDQAVSTFVTRLDQHELLDLLDPGYELTREEIGEMGVAALKLGKRLPSAMGGGARLFERAIHIGPDDPALYSWYTRFAISTPNLELYRRGLAITEENPTMMASFARALAMQGLQSELRALLERFDALHAQRYPDQLAVAVISLANLVLLDARRLPAGSPEEEALLNEVLSLHRRVYELEPTNRTVLLGTIEVVRRLHSRTQQLEHAEQVVGAATRYLELATAMRDGPEPSLTSEVEYAARSLLEWSPPERLDEVLRVLDATLAEHPAHLWLALRRLELAIERDEAALGVAERLVFPARLEERRALLEKRIRLAKTPQECAPDQLALERLSQELPRLLALLGDAQLEAGQALAVSLREALPEHEDRRRLYAGQPRRAF